MKLCLSLFLLFTVHLVLAGSSSEEQSYDNDASDSAHLVPGSEDDEMGLSYGQFPNIFYANVVADILLSLRAGDNTDSTYLSLLISMGAVEGIEDAIRNGADSFFYSVGKQKHLLEIIQSDGFEDKEERAQLILKGQARALFTPSCMGHFYKWMLERSHTAYQDIFPRILEFTRQLELQDRKRPLQK